MPTRLNGRRDGDPGGTVGVLGGLEVRHGRELVSMGHARQRSVLAVLAVEVGRVVPVDALIDRVWGERPPLRAQPTLRTYLTHLRRALKPAALTIIHRDSGYLLDAASETVDLYRFHRLLTSAREQQKPEDALALIEKALVLWRSDPLPELDTAWAREVRHRLHLEHAAAEADRVDWALRCGRHHELLPELTARAEAEPLDERVAGQLMLALYRSSRQADALAHYQHIRQRLVEELGTDPGPTLHQLHHRILTADPTLAPPEDVIGRSPMVLRPVPDRPGKVTGVELDGAEATARTPRQLPRDLPTFVGRERTVADLVALLETSAGSSMGSVIVLHGGPGVGKSALAIHAAHLSAPQFSDGQLHVNLRGATPGTKALSAGVALHQMLCALGVAGSAIPADADEAAALLRTVVSGQQLLIVLDNAATAAQVRPLLPGCSVVITSRSRLGALEGATHLPVGPLSPDEAYEMLTTSIPDSRPAEKPEVTRQLAELCGHLPLALHLAAARLNGRSSWAVSDLVDRLADEQHRLTELAAGDTALRSSLAVSHTALQESDNPVDQRASRALCLFGALPLTDVDLDTATAALDTSLPEADQTIERLLEAHLVEETTTGWFHMHDLARLFARELSAELVPLADQHGALTRVMEYFLATTRLANTLVYAHRAHHPTLDVAASPKALGGHPEALQWLDNQRSNMITVMRQAWRGPTEHLRLGVGLALALHWYLLSGANDPFDTISVLEGAVKAAEELGDRRSLAYAHGNLAVNLQHVGRLDQACEHSYSELTICRKIGDRFGEQRALGNLGYTHLAARQPEQAIGYLEQQLELAGAIDAPIGEAFALVNLGKAHHQLGRSDHAINLIKTGLAWYEKTGDHYRQCDVSEVLARIHIDLGRYDAAITLATHGLEHARRIGYRLGEIWALTTLAQAHRLSGNTDKAHSCAEQAVTASANLPDTKARTDALNEYAQLAASIHPRT